MKLLARIILGLLAVLLLAAVVAVAVSWAPARSAEELSERWAQPPSEFVRVQGMDVHIRDTGPRGQDAPPVVLLHGTSASLHTWNGWAKALDDKRRVIRFDLPGFGLTGPYPGDDYSVERYVDFVTAMLDELELDQVVLAGNSFGGQLAWETAVAEPERIAQLILVDAAGYPVDPEDMPIGFKMAQVPGVKPLMSQLLPRGMIEASVRKVYGDPDQVTPELVDRYYELTLREGNRAALFERFEAGVTSEQPSRRLQQLDVPTLIMWGGQDELVPLSSARRFAEDLPDSKLVIFDELGHVPHEEAPGPTIDAVQRFLAKPSDQ
jgi:pimeloyl-ACP methyl ester carboxylesterase